MDALRTLTPSHLLNARNPLVQAVRDLTGLDPDLKERVGTVAWSGYEALALPRADVPAMAVPPGLQQARALASLNPDNGIRYDADDDYWALGDRRVRGALSMSVLRDGIALVSERLAEDKYEAPRAIGATRSYYVDIMLLAVMQRLAIRDLEDALARLGDDPTTMRGGVAKLDLALMRFRNRLWMTEVSNARVANEVLETLQMNHRLPDRLTELRSGVNDSVRIVDTYELRTTNDLLKILTMASVIIGLLCSRCPRRLRAREGPDSRSGRVRVRGLRGSGSRQRGGALCLAGTTGAPRRSDGFAAWRGIDRSPDLCGVAVGGSGDLGLRSGCGTGSTN